MDVGSHEEYLESDVDGIVLIVLELLWHELLVVLHSPSLAAHLALAARYHWVKFHPFGQNLNIV